MFPAEKITRPLIATVLAIASFAAIAQQPAGRALTSGTSSGDKKTYKSGNAWILDQPLGQHIPVAIDTLLYNYQRQAVPSMVSDAYLTTGNLGAEGMNLIYFERPARHRFFFADALDAWIPSTANQKYYNVYIPMTLLSYNTGGSKENAQDRLRGTFAANLNRRFGFTANLDYIYSKGAYNNQAVKDFIYGFGGYYNGDRYEMQAHFNQYNMLNKENGGITDDLYITDPAQLQGGVDKIEPKSIPTNLSDAHSRLVGSEFYLNHDYKVGYWRDTVVNDTLTRPVYIPVTKFIHTLEYRRFRHVFDNKSTSGADDFWTNRYISANGTHDVTRQWSISNTLGFSTIEGFRPWAKFALAAYARYEYISTAQTPLHPSGSTSSEIPDDNLTPLPFSPEKKHSQSLLWIGGQLSKRSGAIITYDADARFGIAGDVAADVDIRGNIGSQFKLFGDTVKISADGFFRNTAQSYLLQHYMSNHFAWDNDFGKTRDFRVSGKLLIPWTNTEISAGFENIQNLVYFGPDGLPRQNGGSIQLFTARLDQRLHFGIWNWNNTITYQTTSDDAVLPLPQLAIYSNMYLNFRAFRVLQVQIGVDCDYYTRYRAMGYQPALMTFHVMNGDRKVGNYPFCNLYATCKLYKVRFYVLWSHFNQGFTSKDYFAMPGYPLNPRRFQIGLSIDFTN